MKHDITLVTLSQDQAAKAKEVNGKHKHVTHALICGPCGQLFGTEKYCRKYFSVWVAIFPLLFDKSVETESYEISDFEGTFNLVNKLNMLHNSLEKANNTVFEGSEEQTKEKKGLFKGFFAWKNS